MLPWAQESFVRCLENFEAQIWDVLIDFQRVSDASRGTRESEFFFKTETPKMPLI